MPNGSKAFSPLANSNSTFSVSFAAVAMSAAQDVFELVAPTNKRLYLRKIMVGQYSDFGDAQAELISVQIIRGYTVTGSGGSAPTPAAFVPTATSSATVAVNNTTVATGGTAVVLVADTWNVAAGWLWSPAPEEVIVIPAATRVVVRITAPTDAVTANGTLIYEERT